MKPVPPQLHDKFLLYLNDYIQDRQTEYGDVYRNRQVKSVFIEVVGEQDYTIIDFTDSCTLIIADVYSEFEEMALWPPDGVA